MIGEFTCDCKICPKCVYGELENCLQRGNVLGKNICIK